MYTSLSTAGTTVQSTGLERQSEMNGSSISTHQHGIRACVRPSIARGGMRRQRMHHVTLSMCAAAEDRQPHAEELMKARLAFTALALGFGVLACEDDESTAPAYTPLVRSEERRVGKEGR